MRLAADDVVLVTGAGGGLGAATARAVVEAGAKVVLVDLASSGAGDLAVELGDRAVFVPADVTSEADVTAAVAAAAGLGTLRVAVVCAGILGPGRILSRRGVLALEAYRRVIEVNLVGTFNVLRLVAEQLAGNDIVDGDRGVVIMTASIAAYEVQVGQAAYASSKGGVVGLTLPAARDLAEHAIRVVTIAPGVVETPMMSGVSDEVRDALEQRIPHPARFARPEEYGLLVTQIIANPYLNGEVIRLDGALRMQPR